MRNPFAGLNLYQVRSAEDSEAAGKGHKIDGGENFFLDEPEAEMALKSAHGFVVGYLWLAHSSYVERTYLFKLRPKTFG